MNKQVNDRTKKNHVNNNNSKKSISLSGFFGGVILAALGMFSYFIKEPSSAFYGSSKITLIIILLVCGLIGAYLGEKIIEKILSWFSWFG